MAIKRGVSFYSYQQADFFDEMDYRDMVREVHDHLKCDGVEIINMNVVRDYPFPSREWVAQWQQTISRYDMHPVSFDGFLDTMQFRDHVMNYGEAADLIKRDLRLASELGFTHIRTMTALPNAVTERCLETAEKYNVKIAWEIHMPLSIKRTDIPCNKYRAGGENCVMETAEWIEKTGTKWVGFVPDFGIFTDGPYYGAVEAMIRRVARRDSGLAADMQAMLEKIVWTKKFVEQLKKTDIVERLDDSEKRVLHHAVMADPEDLELILPYVCSFHGKAHNMVEDPDLPGHYIEPATRYKEVFDVLKRNNWDGYICTEFEGQAAYGDLPREQFLDEKEQVYRHHQMMIDYGAQR